MFLPPKKENCRSNLYQPLLSSLKYANFTKAQRSISPCPKPNNKKNRKKNKKLMIQTKLLRLRGVQFMLLVQFRIQLPYRFQRIEGHKVRLQGQLAQQLVAPRPREDDPNLAALKGGTLGRAKDDKYNKHIQTLLHIMVIYDNTMPCHTIPYHTISYHIISYHTKPIQNPRNN